MSRSHETPTCLPPTCEILQLVAVAAAIKRCRSFFPDTAGLPSARHPPRQHLATHRFKRPNNKWTETTNIDVQGEGGCIMNHKFGKNFEFWYWIVFEQYVTVFTTLDLDLSWNQFRGVPGFFYVTSSNLTEWGNIIQLPKKPGTNHKRHGMKKGRGATKVKCCKCYKKIKKPQARELRKVLEWHI